MELQWLVWHWDTLVERLRQADAPLGEALGRSCRPLETERRGTGLLAVVLGCWWQPDLSFLRQPGQEDRLNRGLGRMMEERLQTFVVPWPAGFAAGPVGEEGIPAPDLLAGLSPATREEAERCESPIQRYFYAQAYRRGLRPHLQHPFLHYRLDFAFPEQRVAVEVVGWDWHRMGRGAGAPREREEQLGVENWRIRWFSGAEVLSDAGRCLDELQRLLSLTNTLTTRQLRSTSPPGRMPPRGLPSRGLPRHDGRGRRRYGR